MVQVQPLPDLKFNFLIRCRCGGTVYAASLDLVAFWHAGSTPVTGTNLLYAHVAEPGIRSSLRRCGHCDRAGSTPAVSTNFISLCGVVVALVAFNH